MSEFAFELALCSHLEREGDGIVARQLGSGVTAPGGRILDSVVVTPGPSFDSRASMTARAIPEAAIEADVGPGRYRPLHDVIEGPPERARRIADHAAEIGFFERTRIDGQPHVRQVARYPIGWFDDILAIENKPDLGRPGALETQLRTDVELAVADRVVLATESHVTGAHRNRIPDEVGIWRVHRDDNGHDGGPGCGRETGPPVVSVEVVREPTPLPTDTHGVELLDREPGKASIEVVDPDAKARARRRISERAYGKGWRPDEFPSCASVDPTADGRPYCAWAGRVVDPATECGPDCPGHEPAEPPEVDIDRLRADRSDWVAEPDGLLRRQAGLDRFS